VVLALTWRNNLPWKNVYTQPPIIQVLDENGSTSKSGNQVDFRVVEEIIVLALKSCVGFLFDLENNVARLDSWGLIALPSELDFMACSNTPVHVYVEDLSLNCCLLATAILASIFLPDDLTFSVTVRADCLETLDHRSHLAHHRLHTMAVTTSALLYGTFLSTTSITFRADNRFLKSELGNLASVDILERNLVNMVNRASFRRAALLHPPAKHSSKSTTAKCGSSSEELREEVLGVHSATSSTAF
jgi:hypothetical protein